MTPKRGPLRDAAYLAMAAAVAVVALLVLGVLELTKPDRRE